MATAPATGMCKGMPALVDTPLSGMAHLGLSLLDDGLMLPAAVLKESALASNIDWMRRFTAGLGIDLAPHGKTTMSPELFARQHDAGAWGMTAATAHHVRLYASWGVRRILMANQLVGRANLEAVMTLLRADPGLDFYCLVDSAEGAIILADAARAFDPGRPLQLLIEVGGAGERTGARSIGAALEVARACSQRPELVLRGIECFEGVYGDASPASLLLERMAAAGRAIAGVGLFGPGEVIVSAGGSALFDLAARAMLAAAIGRPTRLVLRSGCYVTHDSHLYEAAFEAARARMPEIDAIGRLRPALEVWAHIQSRPEPARAVASLGKRDVGNDIHPPTPLWRYRPGHDAAPRPIGRVAIAKLYDQHACLDVDPGDDLAVGDLIGFGVSHPCTTFDKWRALLLVDDAYRVTGAVTTWF